MSDTHEERERFRRMVDSLEAALAFGDFTPCLTHLKAVEGEDRVAVAVILLAARLLEREAA